MTNNRNASSSAFGWDFQVNSAIFLFLKNIEMAQNIKVEGKKEDIEISLNDNSMIYAQAKSVVDPNDKRNLRTKLEKAVESLNDACDTNCKLIYVTNSNNPFVSETNSFDKVTYLKFSELSQSEQEFIISCVNNKKLENFNYSDFYILDIPFHGEDLENRYKYIKEKVNDFFADIKVSSDNYARKILDVWQGLFFHNSTQNKIIISKEEFLWPLVVLFCENVDISWLCEKYEESLVIDVFRTYEKTIVSCSENFKLVTKIINKFARFNSSQLGNKKFLDYIEKHYMEYRDDIDVYHEDPICKDIVIQLIIYRILCKRSDIMKLKGGTSL